MDDPQPALGAFGRYGRGGGGPMASIERRVLYQRDGPGRVRRVVHYKVRYRDPDGWAHGETFARRVDAERRRIEIEASMVSATWLDPRRGEITLVDVTGTAVQIRGVVTLDNVAEDDTLATDHSRRPVGMARIEQHLDECVGVRADDLPQQRRLHPHRYGGLFEDPGMAVYSRTAPTPPSTASTGCWPHRSQGHLPHRRRPSVVGRHHEARSVVN